MAERVSEGGAHAVTAENSLNDLFTYAGEKKKAVYLDLLDYCFKLPFISGAHSFNKDATRKTVLSRLFLYWNGVGRSRFSVSCSKWCLSIW